MTKIVVDLLDVVRGHLVECALPDPYSVTVGVHWEPITVQLDADGLTDIAGQLRAWADTLAEVTVKAWRTRQGDSVHLQVSGRLADDTRVMVYSGLSYAEHLFGPGLEPGGTQFVSLGVLRHWATDAQ